MFPLKGPAPKGLVVKNNPVNYIDPHGLRGWDTIGKLIAKQIGE